MPLPPNRLRSFRTATRHQCSKGAAAELNILLADNRQPIRLLDRQAGRQRSPRFRRVPLTEVMHRTCLSIAGGLALLARSPSDDLKSSAPKIEVRSRDGVP